MQFDGERYTSGIEGPIQREHYHRYLFALHYCEDKDVLDVASGEGYGSFLLGQAARSVSGVDVDQKAVDFANENYMSERVGFDEATQSSSRLKINQWMSWSVLKPLNTSPTRVVLSLRSIGFSDLTVS